MTKEQANVIYAEEADVLNVAMFGMTAKDLWLNGGSSFGAIKNISKYIVGAGLHGIKDNAEFIKRGESYRKEILK